MFPNAKGSELLAILATLDPASQAAGTATGWISLAMHNGLLAVIQTGALGTGATVDAKVQQALDAVGTGAKDIAGKAISQIIKATGDNKQALINVKPEDLDTVAGFGFVRLAVTVGGAASLTAAQVLGVSPRMLPADASNQAAVAQIISSGARTLIVTAELQTGGKASLTIAQRAYLRAEGQADRLLAEGTIRLGWVDSTTLKPGRIPAPVLEALK